MRPKGNFCTICGSEEIKGLFAWQNVPANIGILWPSRDEARACKKGDLQIVFCENCGYVWNTAFDPDHLEYSQAYDNNLHFSKTYSDYARRTAQNLIDRHQLHGKKILEIGCGKGDFLIMLCTLADNSGIGFDTSFEDRHLDPSVSDRITIVRDFYGEKYANYSGDMIASRYVLEHIENPLQFMQMIGRSTANKKDTVLYFEVPDVYLILEQLSVWDFIYEHVSFFSPGSLATLFEACGFMVLDLYEAFNGQFIGIEAAPADTIIPAKYDIQPDLARLKTAIGAFLPEIEKKKRYFHSLLERIRSQNLRVLVWGAGAKGVSYLNMLEIQDEISYIVDINPNKHGKFIAGTGQKIVPPEFSKDYNPDLVIIMNPAYTDEIRSNLKELGVNPELMTV